MNTFSTSEENFPSYEVEGCSCRPALSEAGIVPFSVGAERMGQARQSAPLVDEPEGGLGEELEGLHRGSQIDRETKPLKISGCSAVW